MDGWEEAIRPNSDQTVGPVWRPRRWVASPPGCDCDGGDCGFCWGSEEHIPS